MRTYVGDWRNETGIGKTSSTMIKWSSVYLGNSGKQNISQNIYLCRGTEVPKYKGAGAIIH